MNSNNSKYKCNIGRHSWWFCKELGGTNPTGAAHCRLKDSSSLGSSEKHPLPAKSIMPERGAPWSRRLCGCTSIMQMF